MPTPKKQEKELWSDKLSRLRKKAQTLGERHGLKEGYRSGLEFNIGKLLHEMNIEFAFEDPKEILQWVPLPIKHKYHPDFVIQRSNGGKKLVIESKGRFMPDDMAKQLAIKLQHPNVEIRFVFQRSNTWYRKAKTRTYAKWCEENGFKYCDMKQFPTVITEWMEK